MTAPQKTKAKRPMETPFGTVPERDPFAVPERETALSDYYFSPEKVEEYRYAMADVLCWLDGFKSGGGTYTPGVETLRNLHDALESVARGQAASVKGHTCT
jgi:hypothetical protein